MSIAKLYSRAISGMNAPEVIVEVHVAGGLPSFSMVGLPDTEVRESRDRVRSAIQNSGFDFPARRITVNLAPADLPKDSGRYDLPIAIGILLASGLINSKLDVEQFEFAGELALDGELRRVNAALAIAFGVAKNTDRALILPQVSANEASLIDGINVYGVSSLKEVVSFLCGNVKLDITHYVPTPNSMLKLLDFSDVKGQFGAKKALEIAAAGRHSMLMVGNPGCGKSMLAARINTILPLLTNEQAIETAALHSITSLGLNLDTWQLPPLRSPHHTSSSVALVGGGSNPKPGEISLAHNGVLFLDELPEFDRKVLEVLREPLENKQISISRASNKVTYLADFQLIAAMNPCPCGNKGHPINPCKCSEEQINRYQNKISAPLLDRVDIILDVPTIKTEELQSMTSGETSEEVLQRVIQAREIQFNRQGKLNYALSNHEIEKYCIMNDATKKMLLVISEKQGLSARSYYRMLKLARTIADLENSETITNSHIALASQYKRKV